MRERRMGEHDALWLAGATRCEDRRGDLSARIGVHWLRRRAGIERSKCEHAVRGIGNAPRLSACVHVSLRLVTGAVDDEARAGDGGNRVDLGGRQPGIGHHAPRIERGYRINCAHRLEAVLCHQHDAVAGSHARLAQLRGNRCDAMRQIAKAAPAARIADRYRIGARGRVRINDLDKTRWQQLETLVPVHRDLAPTRQTGPAAPG